MKAESIAIAMRLSSKPESKVKAFADVTIPLGDEGTITILGFSILDGEGRPPRVMSPGRKGKQTWFDIVQLHGNIRNLIEANVLAEYERKMKGTE
jgi:DNA-binding cell septation regulator SpoVG